MSHWFVFSSINLVVYFNFTSYFEHLQQAEFDWNSKLQGRCNGVFFYSIRIGRSENHRDPRLDKVCPVSVSFYSVQCASHRNKGSIRLQHSRSRASLTASLGLIFNIMFMTSLGNRLRILKGRTVKLTLHDNESN